jgi:heptosyltransferase-2
MKIVVRSPNWIGDAVMAFPAIESLSRNFPEAEIWIAGRDWIKDLFLSLNYVKGIIPLPETTTWVGIREAAKTIKKHDFDAGLLLPNSFSSAFLFFLAKIPQRWGYDRDWRRFLLTKRVKVNPSASPVHHVHYYLNLVSGLGFQASSTKLEISPDKRATEEAKARLTSLGIKLNRPFVVLNPGAFYGPAKRWPESKFARLASLLQDRKNADILIVGSSEEADLAKKISSCLRIKPVILSGKTTLSQLAGLLAHAHLFVSNDSGPMHLATALRIPVVAIFGPTDPRITGPFHQPSWVVKKDVACWPCRHRECPTDHRCMDLITVEDVYSACEAVLK